MTLSLSQLQKPQQRRSRRVGRGNGSGRGTYSGRGLKGQKSRSGGTNKLKRRGVKQFLQQIPKSRGFQSPYSGHTGVNIHQLEKVFTDGSQVNPSRMFQLGLVKSVRMIKILGSGTLSKKLAVRAHAFSASAREAITKAVGTTEVIHIVRSAPKKHQERKQEAA